ncbi:ORF5 protein [Human adenovirus]
MCCWL